MSPGASKLAKGTVGTILGLAVLGCAGSHSLYQSSGGGLLGSQDLASSGGGIIEVRGYALSPRDRVPKSAIGYAVPVFTDRAQATRFCAAFRAQLTFAGSLDGRTPLVVHSYGQTVQIAPFVWPVTSWRTGEKADCPLLVARYNLSGARLFFDIAQRAIVQAGGRPADALEPGPFIVTARRVSGSVVLYDLSRAPDNDYGRWLAKSVQQLSNPTIGNTMLVQPTLRDQVRAFVFGALPVFEGVLNALLPGFKEERARG